MKDGILANNKLLIVQNLVTISFSIVLLIAMVFRLKGNFVKEMYLGVKKDKKQVITLVLLAVILFGMTVALLIIKEDKVTVVYSLFYYILIIAFFEEFVCRGVLSNTINTLINIRKI